jgi:ABC-type nitrate/sulfonate/bicarbonate transport system substrate-binding protein
MHTSISRRQFGQSCIAGAAALAVGSTRSPAAAKTTLAFQAIWLNDPEFLGYMLAIDKGYYAEEGLEISYLPGGPNVIPEGTLLSGKADIAMTTMLTTASAITQKGAALKIIGTQYQKSPLGVLSLASSNIKAPSDLNGKSVAVPTLCADIFRAFARLHAISPKVVPYTFNPAPLMNGEVDACVDFITQIPIIIKQQSGKDVSHLLFDDHGLPLYVDLITVRAETLATKRAELVKFIRASRRGWEENFKDPLKYPAVYHDTWFKGSGSTLEAEKYFNSVQLPLMQSPKGFFALTDEAIATNIKSLEKVGVKASADMFDTSLLAEV